MTYNLSEAIKEAVKHKLDPDYTLHPHLFEFSNFSDKDIAEHQATYTGQSTRYSPKIANRPPAALDVIRYRAAQGTMRVVQKEYLDAAGWRKVRGRRRPIVTYLYPTEWLDTNTGDLISRTDANKLKLRIDCAKSVSERFLDIQVRLNDCSESERPFIAFILKLRNHRGGLVAELRQLLDIWIDIKCPQIRPDHRARKRQALADTLYARKILANSQTLTRELQILGRPTKQEILEEGATIFATVPLRRKDIVGPPEPPIWTRIPPPAMAGIWRNTPLSES